jgi:hypothetical protein
MVDTISNSDTMDDLIVEYLTLVKQSGVFGMEYFQKRALPSENKKKPWSAVMNF